MRNFAIITFVIGTITVLFVLLTKPSLKTIPIILALAMVITILIQIMGDLFSSKK